MASQYQNLVSPVYPFIACYFACLPIALRLFVFALFAFLLSAVLLFGLLVSFFFTAVLAAHDLPSPQLDRPMSHMSQKKKKPAMPTLDCASSETQSLCLFLLSICTK